uniref:Tetraspanin n=1 Tax=Ciona savignyi TaxID=51511 RepID=H2ZH37_CIOSA
MMSGGMKCLKYCMIVFNLLFMLCGATLLGLGIWIVVDGNSFGKLVASNSIILNAVYVIIGVGAALFVIAFLGCCGAIKQNRCLLGTFFAIVLIIFIAQVVGGILAFVFYDRVRPVALDTMNKYQQNSTDPVSVGWDVLQATFQCCGFTNYRDWNETTWQPKINPFPLSCCKRDTFSTTGHITNQTLCVTEQPGYFYAVGCEARVKSYYWAVGGVALGVLVIEVSAF